MKTITIDFNTYEEELAKEFNKGYKRAFEVAKKIAIDYRHGDSQELVTNKHGVDFVELHFIEYLYADPVSLPRLPF